MEEAGLSMEFSSRVWKKPALLLQRAQLARIAGFAESGRELLENALRAGGWKTSKLWWELVSLVSSPADCGRIRDLWLSSPAPCHSHPSTLRAVARAAAVTGNHGDCRTLLRKLIILVG